MSAMGSRWNSANLFISDIRLPAAFHLTGVFVSVAKERDRHREGINGDGTSRVKVEENSQWWRGQRLY